MNPKLKLVKPEEMILVQDMAARIWPYAYGEILSSEQIDYMLEKMYSISALINQKEDGAHFYFINILNEKVGFISYTNRKDDFYINKFYLLPSQMGKNIGTEVYRELEKIMQPAKAVRLNVNRYNIKAINFYFKLGFRIESFEDIKIGAGFEMNDFVMHSNP